MPRGNANITKVHYPGKTEDFIVYVDDLDAYKKWKTDKSVPLTEVVSAFKVFVTNKQGAQGQQNTASKTTLAGEFDTEDVDKAITAILEGGSVQQGENLPNHPGRGGDRNEMQGPRQAH